MSGGDGGDGRMLCSETHFEQRGIAVSALP